MDNTETQTNTKNKSRQYRQDRQIPQDNSNSNVLKISEGTVCIITTPKDPQTDFNKDFKAFMQKLMLGNSNPTISFKFNFKSVRNRHMAGHDAPVDLYYYLPFEYFKSGKNNTLDYIYTQFGSSIINAPVFNGRKFMAGIKKRFNHYTTYYWIGNYMVWPFKSKVDQWKLQHEVSKCFEQESLRTYNFVMFLQKKYAMTH